MAKFKIKRTNILCPECMKSKVTQVTESKAQCNFCGTKYLIKGKTLTYIKSV